MAAVTTVAAATAGAATMAEADMAGVVITAAGTALTTDAVPMAVDIVDAVTSERRAVEDLAAAGAAATFNHVVVAAFTAAVVAGPTVVEAGSTAVVDHTAAVADMVVEGTAKTLRS
jgi:hypothetical protein